METAAFQLKHDYDHFESPDMETHAELVLMSDVGQFEIRMIVADEFGPPLPIFGQGSLKLLSESDFSFVGCSCSSGGAGKLDCVLSRRMLGVLMSLRPIHARFFPITIFDDLFFRASSAA